MIKLDTKHLWKFIGILGAIVGTIFLPYLSYHTPMTRIIYGESNLTEDVVLQWFIGLAIPLMSVASIGLIILCLYGIGCLVDWLFPRVETHDKDKTE